MNNQTKTTNEQREYIERALSSGNYDRKFVETCRILAQLTRNLDSIILDIDGYWSSRMGSDASIRKYTFDKVAHYKFPIFITLTSRYEVPLELIKYRYTGLIKNVSKTIYKNAYRRNKKSFGNIGYVEVATAGNTAPHIHCVFDIPDDYSGATFRKNIHGFWGKINGYIDSKNIIEEHKSSVSAYITKARTKQDFITLQESLVIF